MKSLGLKDNMLGDKTAAIHNASARSAYTVYLTSKAHAKLWELDESLVGTPDYMGFAYFWNIDYKWALRDASPEQRIAVHDAFLRAHLELDEFSPEHTEIGPIGSDLFWFIW